VTGKPGYENVPAGTAFGVAGAGGLCPPEILCGPRFVAAAPDLSHVVLASTVRLTTEAGPIAGATNLYEWVAGKLTFIGVAPEANSRIPVEAVSEDGSRVVFQGSSEGMTGLLLRDVAAKTTVQLDASVGGNGRYWRASGDGRRVFFTKGDLYEYDVGTATTTDLASGGDVQGVAGVSKDGEYVYFAANAPLAARAVHGACVTGTPPPGATCNLYVRHRGTTTLVAVLSAEDNPDWQAFLAKQTARVSPNGEWLAFMSQASLTGYGNRDAVTGHPDQEVYLYHATDGSLVCASCNPTGARPVGVEYPRLDYPNGGVAGGYAVWPEHAWIAANVPGWTSFTNKSALYQSRYLSNDGRLFFNSSDALVPQDVNHTEDVYQYEPPGVPTEGKHACAETSSTFSERSKGCVSLISSGTSPEESAFLDASETGGDVFFLTSARLSGRDFDTSRDVYDAHECTTASPCIPEPAVLPPPCGTGDACKPAPTPQPDIFGAPASATFSGAGNLLPLAPTPPAKPLTNAQKLARALTSCRKTYRHSRARRGACERQARKKFPSKAARAKRSPNVRRH
jgi:hypothetical protein